MSANGASSKPVMTGALVLARLNGVADVLVDHARGGAGLGVLSLLDSGPIGGW